MTHKQPNTHMWRAAKLVGGQIALAELIGASQSTVSRLVLGQSKITPERALAVHRVTGGAVSASELRPDIWPTRLHVPEQPSPHREHAAA